MSLVEPWLIEILRCPDCRAEVVEDEPASMLRCTGCDATFPVRDGIVEMLPQSR